MRRVGETVRCEGAPLGVGGRDRRWGRAAARQPVPRGPRPEGSESEEGTPEDAARRGETDGAAELEPQPEPQPQPARIGLAASKGDWPRRIAEYARDDQEDAAAYAAYY